MEVVVDTDGVCVARKRPKGTDRCIADEPHHHGRRHMEEEIVRVFTYVSGGEGDMNGSVSGKMCEAEGLGKQSQKGWIIDTCDVSARQRRRRSMRPPPRAIWSISCMTCLVAQKFN
jgi:hypothetical protein